MSPFSLERVCESRPELLEMDLDRCADFGGKGTAGVTLLRLSVRKSVAVGSLGVPMVLSDGVGCAPAPVLWNLGLAAIVFAMD
jgi:hypothetical protein